MISVVFFIQEIVERLSAPFGDCIDTTKKAAGLEMNAFAQQYAVEYTQEVSLQTCTQFLTWKIEGKHLFSRYKLVAVQTKSVYW
jgi:hypothetical protein